MGYIVHISHYLYSIERERSSKSRVMSFVFPGFNLTNDQEGDADQDIYWRELGWCGFCSEKVGCCEIMNYSVTNNILGGSNFYERLSCPYGNSIFSSSNITWCKNRCGVCYKDPEETIWKIGVGSYKDGADDDENLGILIYFISLMVTFLGLLLLYVANVVTRSKKSWRRYTLLPMLEPYLILSSLIYLGIIIFYATTLELDPVVSSKRAVCCTQWTSFRLLVLCWWLNFETLVPFNLLLQRSYTIRAFRQTFVSVALVCVPTALLIGCIALYPFGESFDDPDKSAAVALGLAIAVVCVQWMLVGYVFLRLCRNRYYIDSKRHVLIYAIPFCLYYTYLATAVTYQAAGQETVMFWVVICGWSILRLPIMYYCLWAETQFWIRDDKQGRVRRLSRGVIDELQQFLDQNRSILVDYFSIKFGSQIGSGATAQVYKGTYRGSDVAIKVYTPDHIDLELLRSFADEIKIMIPLTHRNVAAVTGLSVMPPHIVIVLPMYSGGDLKNLLDEQIEKQEALIRKKRASLERRRIHGNRIEQFLLEENKIFGEDVENKDASVEDMIPVMTVNTVDDEGSSETKENRAEMTYVAKMAKGDASATLGRLERRKPMMRARESSTSSVESSGYVESKSNGDSKSTFGSDSGRLTSSDTTSTGTLSLGSSYEHLKGRLFDERGLLTWKARLTMAADLCSAVSYLHRRVDPPLLHRDIKPANVLLDSKLHLKLSDFGESCFVSNNMGKKLEERWKRTKQLEKASSRKACVPQFMRALLSWIVCCCPAVTGGVAFTVFLSFRPAEFVGVFSSIAVGCFAVISFFCVYGTCAGLCTCTRGSVMRILCCRCCKEETFEELPLSIRGSPSWMPKEILDGKHNSAKYGFSADCYSTAVCVWQLLSLHPLYRGLSLFKIIRGVTEGTLRPRIPAKWPVEIRDMLTAAWDEDPSKRPSARMMKRTLRRVMKRLEENDEGKRVMVLPLMESLKKMSVEEEDSSSTPSSPRAQLRAYKKGHSNDDVKENSNDDVKEEKEEEKEEVIAMPMASSIAVTTSSSEIEMIPTNTRSGIVLEIEDEEEKEEEKNEKQEEEIKSEDVFVEVEDERKEDDTVKEKSATSELHDETEKDVEMKLKEDNGSVTVPVDVSDERESGISVSEVLEDSATNETTTVTRQRPEAYNMLLNTEEKEEEEKDTGAMTEEKKKKRQRPKIYDKLLN